MNIEKPFNFKPKEALILSPLIPILLFIGYFLINGSFKLDVLEIVGTFAGIYYVILYPILLKICQILIAKKLFIFPFIWLGAHLTLVMIYFFITTFQNFYYGFPIFESVGRTLWDTAFSLFIAIVSFVLSIIFWSFSTLQPKLKLKK